MPPMIGMPTPSTAGSTTSAAGASSSSCSGCTRTTSSATCSGRSRGRSCPFRRSPKPTRCTRSRPSGDRNASPGGTARRCTPRASRSPPSRTSAAPSASTISLASISNPRHLWVAGWSRKHGSSVTASTSGPSASSTSCRAGIPPTRRPSSATSASARPWGIRGKNLYLLGLLRQRLEYPALKRAVREQQNLFDATEVLIEDKASGTQLIQELIADGCHRVTRYQPTTDKTMRLNAQTAIIENGFVYIPEAAPWLAEYLHEMTVFPNGKHDDQVDSTAQFLDWFKRPMSNQGIFEYYRKMAEKLKPPEPVYVRLKAPPGIGAVEI